MAGNREMEMNTVFADEGPANQPVSGHGSGPVHSLHRANGSFVIFNEVIAVWCDGEGASRVEDDVDEGNIGLLTGYESCHEVRIEIGTLEMGVEG